MHDPKRFYSLPQNLSVFAHPHFWLAIVLQLAIIAAGTAFIVFVQQGFE